MPADASLLSALGLGRAVLERFAEKQVLQPARRRPRPGWPQMLESMRWARRAAAQVAAEGVPQREIVVRRRMVNLRLAGPGGVDRGSPGAATSTPSSADRYRAMYGTSPGARSRSKSIRASGVIAAPPPGTRTRPPRRRTRPRGGDTGRARSRSADAQPLRGPVAGGVRPGSGPIFVPGGRSLEGPALGVRRPTAPTSSRRGGKPHVDEAGALVLHRPSAGGSTTSAPEGHPRTAGGQRPEVVRQELFTNRFTSIARQMGRMLQRTALVHERQGAAGLLLRPSR